MNIRRRIIEELLAAGVAPHQRGFVFMVDCIERMIDHDMYGIGIVTKAIYPNVGALHGVSRLCVERCIRYAITEAGSASTNSRFMLDIAMKVKE